MPVWVMIMAIIPPIQLLLQRKPVLQIILNLEAHI